jgi:hypothetical protein
MILLSMPSRAPSFSIIASHAPFRLTSESRHREGHLKPHEEHVKIVRVVAQTTLDQLDVEKMSNQRRRARCRGSNAQQKIKPEEKDWTNFRHRLGLSRPKARMSHDTP